MNNANGITPVDFPQVKIAGVSYFLKFGPGAQLRMERMGWTDETLRKTYVYETDSEGQEKIVATTMPLSVMFAWLAACAGRMVKGRWTPIEFSPEQLADAMSQKELLAVGPALTEMFSKAKPEGEKTPEPAPADQPVRLQEPEPLQIPEKAN